MASREQRHLFGERERCPLPGGKERRLAPDRQRVDTLLGLADGPGVLGVHVDAVGAAVQLRRPDPDQLAQPRVESDLVELLGGSVIEMRHRLGEACGLRVEVEPYVDRGGVSGCHEDNATDLVAQEYGPYLCQNLGPIMESTCTWRSAGHESGPGSRPRSAMQ